MEHKEMTCPMCSNKLTYNQEADKYVCPNCGFSLKTEVQGFDFGSVGPSSSTDGFDESVSHSDEGKVEEAESTQHVFDFGNSGGFNDTSFDESVSKAEYDEKVVSTNSPDSSNVSITPTTVNVKDDATPPNLDNEKVYITKFSKTEDSVRSQWFSLLLKDENAPLDVVHYAKITSIKKEYYPVAVYDYQCQGEWQATSIWEHDETYTEPVQEKYYIDRETGREKMLPGLNTITRTRVVYKDVTRTVTDSIQRTSGFENCQFKEIIWLNTDETRNTFDQWRQNYPDTQFVKYSPEAAGDAIFKAQVLNGVMSKQAAESNLDSDISNYLKGFVPGDRFEDFGYRYTTFNQTKAIFYFGIYHISYEYKGEQYDYYVSGHDNPNDYLWNAHPVDTAIKNRTDSLKKQVDNNSGCLPILWIVLSAIGIFFFLIAALAGAIASSPAMGIVFLVLCLACVGSTIFFSLDLAKRNRKKSEFTKQLNSYNQSNAQLRTQILDLVNNDLIPADDKKELIEDLINKHQSSLAKSAEANVKKTNPRKVIAIVCICLGALLVIGVSCFAVTKFVLPKIHEAATKPVVLSEDKIDVGDEIEFGSYKSEAIEWIVLDKEDDKILVISKDALFDYDDRVQYDDWPRDVTWSSSNLRKHLNSDEFLNSIFTESEQNTIIETKISTADNPYYGTPGGKDTFDKLFLPSAYDVVKYFDTTKDARCNWITEGEKCAYWLRTPGKTATQVVYVAADGSIDFEGDSSTEYTVFSHLDDASFSDMYVIVSARPMMWLKLDTYDEEDDDFEYGDSDLINEIVGETASTTTNRTTDSTTNSSSGSNNDSIRYKKQAYAGLTYEIPSDSTVETGNDGQMIFGFPSECCGVIIYAIDLDDNQINAGNETSYNNAMLQSFIDENSGTNVQYFDTIIDGKTVPSALCNISYNGTSLASELIVFCNNDYSKMYIIVFSVFDPSAFNETDEAIFNHFIESIKIG
jgi:hypothetical protein